MTLPCPEDEETWYSYQGIALHWNYPLGVLYEIFVQDGELPWKIQVHFKVR
jgi:hypothetical protein